MYYFVFYQAGQMACFWCAPLDILKNMKKRSNLVISYNYCFFYHRSFYSLIYGYCSIQGTYPKNSKTIGLWSVCSCIVDVRLVFYLYWHNINRENNICKIIKHCLFTNQGIFRDLSLFFSFHSPLINQSNLYSLTSRCFPNSYAVYSRSSKERLKYLLRMIGK